MITSGFTTDLTEEMNEADAMAEKNEFRNISLYYESESGHARLFTATRYGKRFMLKCLKSDFQYTPVYHQIQNKEFEIGVQLEHPNICRTIGLEQVEGLGPVIIMEYVDGDNLQTLIDKGALTVPLAKNIADQLMDALEYMHVKQVVHRDLKPSNIMVTHHGHNVKVVDFGLSDSDSFYILKAPAGTSGYIAPEQLLPEAKPEPVADIYSLGCVIKEMAKVANCRKLKTMVALCTVRDAGKRPKSIDDLRLKMIDYSALHLLVVALSIGCLVLVAAIAGSYYYKYKSSDTRDGATPRPYEGFVDSVDSGGNKVLDYRQW